VFDVRGRTLSLAKPALRKAKPTNGLGTTGWLAWLASIGMTLLLSAVSAAQTPSRTVQIADSAFAAGNITLADSLYYFAVRQRPRHPADRAALGRYLGSRGKAKFAVVLLEEARMFGADPAVIARQLVPLYAYLGEWRALLTLPAAPLTSAERRRIAWLSEHLFGATIDGTAASMVGSPKGDTIARVPVKIGGRSAVASIVGNDVGIMIGSRMAGVDARHFEGDSTVVAFDSITIAQAKFVNVPATIGAAASTMIIGAPALARRVLVIDYGRNRLTLAPADAGSSAARYLLIRVDGRMQVLDRGRWVSLGEFVAPLAKASKTIVVDVAAGEVRIRP
jgi:hypothetical protein